MRTLFVLFVLAPLAFSEIPFLDRPYPSRPRVRVVAPRSFKAAKPHILANIQAQSPVKSQGARGTCSIFSATALAEALLIKNFNLPSTDLSEEWLEYLITRNASSDGSNSDDNLSALLTSGTPTEKTYPYIGSTWEIAEDSETGRCNKVPSQYLKSCLLAHRDPRLYYASDAELSNVKGELYDLEFLEARKEAASFRTQYFKNFQDEMLRDSSQIKQSLENGIPVLIDLDFYYGAWNHAAGESLGIVTDAANWSKGLVGYPEPGSMDYKHSHDDPAGHSVLIVGYDDNIEIKTHVLMTNGKYKDFTYKGVFIIKNSWGTTNFGAAFEVEGQKFPGYGMLTQKYAYRYGSFFRLKP